MFKIGKTGNVCYKISKPFQNKNVEFVQVLVPLGFESKKGNLASIQTVKVSNLVEV